MDDDSDTNLLDHVLLPVAHEADARRTAQALEPYHPDRVTVTHVVEKGNGKPSTTPVGRSEDVAADAHDAVCETFPRAEKHTTYRANVVEGIFDAATEVGATAVAYQAREGNRLLRFLSGDLSLKLVTQPPVPVVSLPPADE